MHRPIDGDAIGQHSAAKSRGDCDVYDVTMFLCSAELPLGKGSRMGVVDDIRSMARALCDARNHGFLVPADQVWGVAVKALGRVDRSGC